jgi:hypothetical protein
VFFGIFKTNLLALRAGALQKFGNPGAVSKSPHGDVPSEGAVLLRLGQEAAEFNHITA